MDDCAPGQRWISNTEPELGLGIVYEVENRRVVLTFPAGDERRTYALDNAPLTRVRYRIADRIRSDDGIEMVITEQLEANNCLIYRGLDPSGAEVQIHEVDLDSFVQFNRPLDRLFTGQVDKSSRFKLRTDTLKYFHQQKVSLALGLIGPRVQLLPHQFYIADEVTSRFSPRVLLADEVGLGKTIEAGLIMHRLNLLGRVRRVLVVVPDHLLHQWLVEMMRRFNLQFSIIDEDSASELEADGEANPFESAQFVLLPLSTLTTNSSRLAQAESAGWDLLVVDEAHHLQWSETSASPQYQAIATLAASVPGLLLLTATPEQLGVSGHFARLALLDPHRYNNLPDYQREEAGYSAIAELVSAILEADEQPDDALLARAAEHLGAERVAAHSKQHGERCGQVIIRDLLDHHGTGRVLFRNCRDNIKGFPQRHLQVHTLAAQDRTNGTDDAANIAHTLTPEVNQGEQWMQHDARAAWLVAWLKTVPRDKVLIICTHRDSAETLELWLRTRHGFRTAVFHEGLDLIQRDRAAAYFADPEEDAQALVCSEIGSEGRNFQFARHLVLFDLPFNPDLLEQRIGRLDRIGQRHDVEIHVPVWTDSAASVWLDWLHQGLDAFEQVCPMATTLFAQFETQITQAMLTPQLPAEREALIESSTEAAAQLRQQLQAGRNQLLELNSFEPQRAATVINEITALEQAGELPAYMAMLFDAFGVEHEDNGDESQVVHPGDHMSVEAFPGLPEGGVTVTFDREQALARDDMQFLSWEHPMVSGAMDLVLSGEFGNASFGVVKARGLEPASLLIECFFVIVCPAPATYRVERYLQQSNLRVVVDSAGNDRSNDFPAAWFQAACKDIPKGTAQKVITRARAQIEQLSDHAQHMAEVQQEPLINAASERMQQQLGAELDRMRQLAEVNPNVRPAEIEALAEQAERMQQYLEAAQLKLDAVRVVIAT